MLDTHFGSVLMHKADQSVATLMIRLGNGSKPSLLKLHIDTSQINKQENDAVALRAYHSYNGVGQSKQKLASHRHSLVPADEGGSTVQPSMIEAVARSDQWLQENLITPVPCKCSPWTTTIPLLTLFNGNHPLLI